MNTFKIIDWIIVSLSLCMYLVGQSGYFLIFPLIALLIYRFIKEKNMFLWASDKYGRYYGVQKFDLHSKRKKTFIVNCSIKNISQIINLTRSMVS